MEAFLTTQEAKRRLGMRSTRLAPLVFVLSILTHATAHSWVGGTVDSRANTGGGIALDSTDKVHISYYYDYSPFPIGTDYLRYATNASGAWVRQTVDSDLGMLSYSSIALDSLGKAHISYAYNVGPSLNSDLKYATNVSGSWVIETVESGLGWWGEGSIALDSLDKVHISYNDSHGNHLKYATNASGSWVIETLDSPSQGVGVSSLALDSADNVYISYSLIYEDPRPLMYLTNASGFWVTTVVDSGEIPGGAVYTSIALDDTDKVHIMYYDPGSNLNYATNASGSWVIETLDSAGLIGGPVSGSIALDSLDRVHISYENTLGRHLKYATNASGMWATTTVASTTFSGLGLKTLALDSLDKVHIGYVDANEVSFGPVKYVTEGCVGEACYNGIDDDCDGDIDGTDSDCLLAYTTTANAEASAYGSSSLSGSGVFNALTLLLVPMGAVIVIRILRRKRKETHQIR
jgi:hypothetical protein